MVKQHRLLAALIVGAVALSGCAKPVTVAYPNPSFRTPVSDNAGAEPTRTPVSEDAGGEPTKALPTSSPFPSGAYIPTQSGHGSRPTPYPTRPWPPDWIFDISFLKAGYGWLALQDKVVATSDSGATWRTLPSAPGPIALIDFVSPLRGWVCTSPGDLYATKDGGLTWTVVVLGPANPCMDLDFVDSQTGWVVTDVRMLRTSDGAKTWTPLEIPCPDLTPARHGGHAARTVSFLSPTRGWYICHSTPATIMEPKALYFTEDGGQTWRLVSDAWGPPGGVGGLPISGYYPQISFLDEHYGWMATGRMNLYITSAGGRDWKHVDYFMVDGPDVRNPVVTSVGHGYLILFGRQVIRTDDGGLSWETIYPR